jgi:hypothetical protein
MTNSNIPAYQQRVINERDELGQKKFDLHNFFSTAIFAELPIEEKVRLKLQYEYMTLYYEILASRIQNFQ